MLLSLKGPIAAGKTVGAKYLGHYGFVPVSFADPLKLEVFDALWSSDPALKGYNGTLMACEAVKGGPGTVNVPTPAKFEWIDTNKAWLRGLLQWWGTEYRRAQNPNYWLERFTETVDRHRARGWHVVVDDCRFVIEIDLITDIGGKHVYILTARAQEFELARDGKVANVFHASERTNDPLDPRWDYIIVNKGDLTYYYRQLDALAANLLDHGA